jgi:hypothetical protein
MTVRINKQKINLREKLTEFEDKVNFDEVVRGLGEYTGSVGIGNTQPAKQLHIKNTAFGDTGIAIENTNNAQNLDIDFYNNVGSAQGRIRYSEGSGSFSIFPDVTSSSALTMLYGGNVGIGTTSPLYSLDVYGFNKAIGITSTHADGTRITHASLQTDASGYGSVSLFNSVGNPTVRINSNADSYFNGGNVGIGTTSPGVELHIKAASTSPQATLKIQGGSTSGYTSAIVFANSDDTDNGAIYYNADSNFMRFNVGGLGINTEKMRINSSGNVGIGVADPGTNKLYVNGNIYASGTITPSSDDRVKHNEQAIVGAIEMLGKLSPKKYIKTTEMYEADHDFELDADGNPVDENGEPVEHSVEAGVIAQQVLDVPELAFMVSPEGVDENGNVTSPHGLNYNSLFTYAIAAIQEQQSIIEDLKSRIETLESK